MIWFDLIWFDLIWFDLIWIIWFDLIWYCLNNILIQTYLVGFPSPIIVWKGKTAHMEPWTYMVTDLLLMHSSSLQTFKGLIAETLHDHFGEWTPIVLTCPPISSDYIIIIGIYTLFWRGLLLSKLKQYVIIIFIISNIGKTSLQYLSIFLCLRGNNSQWYLYNRRGEI